MDFEEKMDAVRMNLELASHDIESLRESIRELRDAATSQHESIESLRASTRALQDASVSQFESIRVLGKTTEDLLATALRHDQRITGLERRA
jgi:predicted  nucleic acid-binding Zn-ribbon protein